MTCGRRAPRNPPFCRIRLFFNDVFFDANFVASLATQTSQLCGFQWNVTFYDVLRALADTVEKLSITLFDELSFGSISQSVYLLRPLTHLAVVFYS